MRRKLLGIWLFSLWGILGFSFAQNGAIERANALENMGELSKSIEYYQWILNKNTSQEAVEGLGRCNLKLKNYASALEHYETLVRDYSPGPVGILQCAELQLMHGKLESAIENLRKYAAHKPQDTRIPAMIAFIRNIPAQKPDTNSLQLTEFQHNSAQADFGATYFEEGILFCSSREANAFGVKYETLLDGKPLVDLYYSELKDDGCWGNPKRLPSPVNSRFHDGPACQAPDGALFFSRSQLISSMFTGEIDPISSTIMLTKHNGKNWERPRNLFSDVIPGAMLQPSLSADGKTLYFVSDMEGGFGGADIWKLKLTDGVPGNPVNLGATINTPGNELFPFIHPNGSLYFSSNGHPGFGGLDVFEAVLYNEKFNPPQNLGLPFNSSFDDFSYVSRLDNRSGFIASNRKSQNGNDELYTFVRKSPDFKDCKPQKENVFCFLFSEEFPPEELEEGLYYQWDFSDGTSEKGLEVRHCFQQPGYYSVSLKVYDSEAGEPVLNESSKEFTLDEIIQPYIASDGTGDMDQEMTFDATQSNLPEMVIQEYYWDFGDGTSGKGAKVTHAYRQTGDFTVTLGVIGFDKYSGISQKQCVTKNVTIGAVSLVTELAENPSQNINLIQTLKPIFNIRELKDPTFRIQLGTSPMPIPTEPQYFFNLEGVQEFKDNNIYRYFYGEKDNPDSALKMLDKIKALGFNHPTVVAFDGDKLVENQGFEENWLPGEQIPYSVVMGQITLPSRDSIHKGGKVIYEDLETGDSLYQFMVESETGSYMGKLSKDKDLGVIALIEGYYPVSRRINLKDYKGDLVIKEDLKVIPFEEMINKGVSVRMNNLFFETGSAELRIESEAELHRVLIFLFEHPELSIEINGYTDDQGNHSENIELSRKRASSVAKYLAIHGIRPERMLTNGLGEAEPIVPNDSQQNRAINRRVEFRIVSKGP